MAWPFTFICSCVNGSAHRCDTQLQLHEIESRDHLGDRVSTCRRVFISMK